MRVLFLCRRRIASYGATYGLYNSALMVARTLTRHGIDAHVEAVVDGNGIDRAVTRFDPTHVIIEALWVTPEKLRTLLAIPRHRRRAWVVRLHSKIPFLAMEGIALEWLDDYRMVARRHPNFCIAANTRETCDALAAVFDLACSHQPNIYPLGPQSLRSVFRRGMRKHTPILDIGCFGAIRPLKNQLIQAIAAIDFADGIGKRLRFHINADRMEQRGEAVLKNLRALFRSGPHCLVEHDWWPHDRFVELVRWMDLGLQVSYTETFNIVAADFVSQNIPIVVSNEIPWTNRLFQVDPNSKDSIVAGLHRAYRWAPYSLHTLNYISLRRHNQRATETWLRELWRLAVGAAGHRHESQKVARESV